MLIATAWFGSDPASRNDRRTSSRGFAILVALLIAFQALQGIYTYTHSVNGIALNGELRGTGIGDLIVVNARAEELARRIRIHWEGLGRPPGSHPTIATFAEGVLPYRYREARVFGGLVSYRRDCRWRGRYPVHYSVYLLPSDLAEGPGTWRDRNGDTIVSTQAFVVEGRSVVAAARFDPDADPPRLPPRVRGPCVDPRASS